MPTNHNSTKKPMSLRHPTAAQITSALALSTSLLSPVIAQEQEDVIELGTLKIEERTIDTNPYAQAGAPYKAKVSGDSRRVKPLAETPATISVLTQTQLQDSGRDDLREVLAGQPGITLGTGENGNAFGDRYVIRGHEARSDVFVDGLRDPGMTTRESFATEQVEITKGPSSTFAGRGSTGGAINSITKQASTEYDFAKVQGGVGTDNYRRLTLDTNQTINSNTAVRINALHAYEDVPDRGPADRERNGFAISGLYNVNNDLTLVADYYFLEADDKPDLGTYIDRTSGKAERNIPVYVQNQDFLKSTINTFTLRADYDIAPDLTFKNSLRYGTTENGYINTGARGTTRADEDPIAPGVATISLSTHQGWQDVEYFVNQSNLFWETNAGGMDHQWLFSLEYSDLNVTNGNYAITNNGETNCMVAGRGGVSPSYCALDASGNTVSNLHNLMQRSYTKNNVDADYNVETLSLAVMDTIDITDEWTVFAGLRMDRFDYLNSVVGRGASTATDYDYSDTLWNGHLGVVYNLTDNINYYLTYSTSANINGGESDVGGSCGYGGLCGDVDQVVASQPEKTQNIELGTKWNIMDEKLLLSASVFQITKDDVMESVGDDYAALGTLNTGKNRIRGLEISATGNITDKLSTQFGVAIMNSEVIDSYTPENVGLALANFADDSAFLQLRYEATDAFYVGASVTYSSEMYAGQPDTAAGWNSTTNNYSVIIPSYTYFDAFASYAVNDQLSVRLNIGNLTDKDYYLAAYRSGSFTYIGDARTTRLTVSYEF